MCHASAAVLAVAVGVDKLGNIQTMPGGESGHMRVELIEVLDVLLFRHRCIPDGGHVSNE